MSEKISRNIITCHIYKCLINKELSNELEIRFWGNVHLPKATRISGDCWEWVGHLDKYGYGQFSLYGKIVKAHRLAYELVHGIFDKRKCVCHECDNPKCVSPAHLWLGTQKDNVRDMIKKGRYIRPKTFGQHNGMSKLKRKDVIDIKKLLRKNIDLHEIATYYGISLPTIYDIKARRTWKHVK